MKKTPERIETLAAEYVLGSLKGQARKRFERWMMESVRVRQEVWFWEERLGELVLAIPPVSPSSSVWRSIEGRVWPGRQQKRQALSSVSWLWPSWSMLATAAAMVLAIALVVTAPQNDGPSGEFAGAVVQPDIVDPLWLVSGSAERNQLRLRPVAASQAEVGKDYELWAVPAEGNPLSLGVLNVGGVYQVPLSDEARELLSRSRTLAISLEAQGGSSTGAPSGPILHIINLYEL